MEEGGRKERRKEILIMSRINVLVNWKLRIIRDMINLHGVVLEYICNNRPMDWNRGIRNNLHL